MRLVLDEQKPGSFKSCQRLCNGRCSRDVYIHIPYRCGTLRKVGCPNRYRGKCYHIGVSFEVVRFDKMGLPGPLFVKRATGKFTLSFVMLLNLINIIKTRV